MQISDMVKTHPHTQGDFTEELLDCIEKCNICAQICISCSDACLAEENSEKMKQCIRLNLDCAVICAATAAIAIRRTVSNQDVLVQMIQACESACRACAEECEKHGEMHDHCRICAESCRDCEKACNTAAYVICS